MDKAGKRLKIEKREIAKSEAKGLGYHLSKGGIKPGDKKVQAITENYDQKF